MRIQLGQGSRLELTAQAGRVFESGVGAAFRVCDEHPEAALAEFVGRGMKGASNALEGSLHQQPAGAGWALGEQVELLLVEPADHVIAELAAAAQLHLDSRPGELVAQLAHAVVDLPGVGDPEIQANVRGGHDRPRPIGDRGPGQVEALGQVGRAVVDAGQDVK